MYVPDEQVCRLAQTVLDGDIRHLGKSLESPADFKRALKLRPEILRKFAKRNVHRAVFSQVSIED